MLEPPRTYMTKVHTSLSLIARVLRGFEEVRCAPNLNDKALHTSLSLISCVFRGSMRFDELEPPRTFMTKLYTPRSL